MNPQTRALLSLIQTSDSFTNESISTAAYISTIRALIDKGAHLTIKDANGNNAFSLAIKTNQPEIINLFRKINPVYFNNKVSEMQAMWLIGKEKDGIFTAGEMDRTQMDETEKALEIVTPKTEGLEKGKIVTQSNPKREDKAPTAYLLKEAVSYSLSHLREVIGARCYAYFAGGKGTIMAKTRLVTKAEEESLAEADNRSSIPSSQEVDDRSSISSSYKSLDFSSLKPTDNIALGSRILPQNFVQYSRDNGPRIKDGELVASINGRDQAIKGYISAMTVAKFIQDFDCDGIGTNDGYMLTDLGVKNVKIDPGRALGFMDDLHTDITDVSEGIAILLTYQMLGDEYRTFIPLEYIDLDNPNNLRPETAEIGQLLRNYYPNLDTRDPVIGKITYLELLSCPNLYQEFAETIYDITTCSEENLSYLITHNLPDTINGLEIAEDQNLIFEKLKLRQQIMKALYPTEIEYMRIYNKLTMSDQPIDFGNILAEASEISATQTLIFNYHPLVKNEEFSQEIAKVSKKLLNTSIHIKLDPEHQQSEAILEKAEAVESLLTPKTKLQDLLTTLKQAPTITSWVNKTGKTTPETTNKDLF